MKALSSFGVVGRFEAAHHLVGGGLCEAPHGHTYEVEAVWNEPSDARLSQGRHALRAALAAYDHRDLNQLMEYPSCENLCAWLAKDLAGRLEGLRKVTVHEGKSGWAEVHLEGA